VCAPAERAAEFELAVVFEKLDAIAVAVIAAAARTPNARNLDLSDVII